MDVDNRIYDGLAASWWDQDGVLGLLDAAVNPVRFEYFRTVLSRHFPGRAQPCGLDVGCGGGALAESFARGRSRMAGVDPSRGSLRAARKHASEQALEIAYLAGRGEALPFPDALFDFVCCCDVLEHVPEAERVVAEAARVLRPGGLLFYDTINRTARSRLVAVEFAQHWRWSRFLPRDVHRWERFVRPEELTAMMGRRGVVNRETRGMKPGVHPLRVVLLVRRLKRGRLTYREFGSAIRFRLSRDLSVGYVGYGVRTPVPGM